MGLIHLIKSFALTIRESANDGSDFSSPDADYRVLYLGEDGYVHTKDSSGTVAFAYSTVGATVTTPTFVAAGASASGTGAVVPGLPAGHTTNDINILFVQSDNQTVLAPAGWTQLGPEPGIGTAAAALATRLAIFWKRDGGADTDPTVADTGDHTLAQIIGIRGCPTTGDPFVINGQTRKATASTTGTGSSGTTNTDNCLVVQAFAHGLDSATAVFSSWTNASLSSVTERVDVATADGNGGGIGVATGILATAGPFVATTVTETSTADVGSTFYMLPADRVNVATAAHTDRQLFLTPGFADTWTKPTGAKWVDFYGIGAGASGSGGRNAATAAGGGGGGAGAPFHIAVAADELPSTLTVTAGAGGAATAHSDGAASNAGTDSRVTDPSTRIILFASNGGAAGASGSGSGGLGGGGGGRATNAAAGVTTWDAQGPGGGTGGTTAMAGGSAYGMAGGAGAGGGTTQAASAGGNSDFGGGGGGGGRSNTNVGTGGGSMLGQLAGGATAGAAGADSPYPSQFGGSGGAGGTSAAGTGGRGGWPGGAGGGGGSQSGAQGGGAGGDGVVTVTTYF